MKKLTKDFTLFSPSAYLDRYYAAFTAENRSLLKFFHRTYNLMTGNERLLEIGGGPTIYQLISASSKVREIIFSEFLPQNRHEIQRWIAGSPKAFNWDKYIIHALELEGKKITPQAIENRKKIMRSIITSVVYGNIYRKTIIQGNRGLFDVVSVNFVPESITNNERDYLSMMKNISSIIPRRGRLVMTALQGASFYCVGNLKFPAFNINEKYLKGVLEEYDDVNITTISADTGRDYNGLLLATAVKK